MHDRGVQLRTLTRLMPLAVLAVGCTAERDPCASPMPGMICGVAGTGEAAFNGDGLLAAATAFYLPSQVRRGPDGLLYIMDFNNHRLRRIAVDGVVTTIAGDGFHAGAIPGALATESSLENPVDFDFLPDGRVVFVSYHDPRVIMIDHDGTLRIVAGAEAGIRGDEGDGGSPLEARFIELQGIAVAADGDIYLADAGANRIRVLRGGIQGVVETFAGIGGSGGYSGDGGPATDAAFDRPTALATDEQGAVFVTDSSNCVVRRIAPDGTIATVAGTGPGGELSHPEGIIALPDGTLYVGDRFNNVVRKVAADGTLTTLVGSGQHGDSGDGGPAETAQLGYVARISLDIDGSLLIADQSNGRIRRVIAP